MGADVGLSISFVCGFLLVLARVSGAIVFVPIPGVAASPEPVRAVFALSLTMALAPFWPAVAQAPPVGTLLAWLAGEASLGLAIGLVISFLDEGFTMFGQLVGMQAGYSFASIIDPFSQADSGVCIVLAQTMAGLLFFTTGLHRLTIRIFAESLQAFPPGAYAISPGAAALVIRLSSMVLTVGLRLALPFMALMVTVDVAMALLGRINQRMQLLMLAFPVKMLASLAVLAAMAAIFPRVYQDFAARLFEALPALASR